jgi:hypothetical protein
VKALPQSLALAVVAVAALGCRAKQDSAQQQAGVATPVASPAPASPWNPTFTDIEGQTHRPCDEPGVKAVALVFILTDCPIANSYIPALNRLHAALEPRGVRLFLVHADASVTAEQAREHARQYEIGAPVILDPKHALVKQAQATRTPEAVVFSPKEEVLYRGRIDDQYVGVGQRRTQVTSHDLEEAAQIDGAGPLTIALRLKLPLIRKWIAYMAILSFATGTQLFIEPQLVNQASLGLVPDTWSSNQLAYQLAFRYGDFNGAAAISVDLLVIGLVAALLVVTRTGLFRAED